MLFVPSSREIAILPIIIMAIILSPCLVDWLTGTADFFDPSSLVTVLLFQFMVISPFVNFVVDRYNMPMENTRVLLARTTTMCAITLIAFIIGRSLSLGERICSRPLTFFRETNISIARSIAVVSIIVGLLATVWLRFVVTARGGTWATRFSATTGLGYIVTFKQFLPIGLMLLAAVSVQRYQNRLREYGYASRTASFMAITAISLLLILQVALKGSRGLIIMYIFWVLGFVHFSLKKMKLVYFIIPIILAIPLLHIYSLYKSFGIEAFQDYFIPARRAAMEEASNRRMTSVITGDLGRMSVWMFANQEISSGRFEHTLGKTYIEGSVAFVPRAIWPGRPHGMAETITDMVSGKGAYAAKREKTARVAGLIGEAYINFGWLFAIFAMFVYGILVRSVTTWVNNSPNTTAKAFFAPLLIMFLFFLFIWDWVWIVFKTFSFYIPCYFIYRWAMPRTNYIQEYEPEILYNFSVFD
jgi:hypothetical protein